MAKKPAELERPTTKPPRLKVGKRYKFTPIVSNPGKTKGNPSTHSLQKTPPFLGTVLEEYATFYLVVTPGGYRTTMLKNALGFDWAAQKMNGGKNK
jgi:hypothetical protein